ncbi:MAG TPA: hypothetical protein VFS76_17375 [Pyrinomonadaceae bacterium]|nr:hypothetical protein [Pyrinomonadaceae bacterium]
MGTPDLEILEKTDLLRQKEDLLDQYEAKLQDNQPLLRNLITGIDTPSREAVQKTIATAQTLRFYCTSPRIVVPVLYGVPDAETETIADFQSSLISASITALIAALAARLSEETLSLTAGALANANRINFTTLGAMAGSAALAALDFSKVKYGSGHLEAIQTSYSGRLASTLRDILNQSEITDETVKPLEALINIKVSSLPQNRVSAEGMFTMLTTQLAIIGSYETHRHYFQRGSAVQVHHLKPLRHIVGGVLENTRRLIPQNDPNTYYRVLRQVDVSVRPKPSGYHVVGVLVPDQTVRLVERGHKWISVEYFDQLQGVARQGWAPKKYFEYVSGPAAQPAKEAVRQSSSLSERERREINEDWEETNQRRIDLIYKEAESKLTSEEKEELDRLQRLTDERIRLVAPLPLAQLESVLEKLERRT